MHKNLCLYLIVLILVISFTLASPASVQSQRQWTVAEQWVLQQIASGNPADMQSQFPNEEDHVIRADFLLMLLENPEIEITRYGIHIENAIFNEPLDLDYITVDSRIWLTDCKFNDYLSLYESHFTRDLYFSESTFLSVVDLTFSRIDGNFVADDAKFLNPGEAASFNSIKVNGLLSFQNAEFAGSVDFTGAEIGVTFDAENAHFNSKEESVSFNSMIVDEIFLDEASFQGSVDFGSAEIAYSLNVGDAYFHSEDSVNFNSIKVGRQLDLSGAKFWGPVNFIRAQIGSNLNASEAQFNNNEEQISFNSMRVDGTVFLRKAEFAGPADFIGAQIGGSLLAGGVRFNHIEKEVSFNSIKVDGSVFLREVEGESELTAEFAGPVNFGYAQIGRTFEAHRVHFKNSDQRANFNSMEVNDSVFLTEAEFAGPVDFLFAQMGGNLEAGGALFHNKNPEQIVHFGSMQIEGNMFLHRAVFDGPVSFLHAQIGGNVDASDALFHNKNPEQIVNFGSMQIGGNMFLRRAVFAGAVSFGFTEIKYNLEADHADFKSESHIPSFDNMIVRQGSSFEGTTFRQGADFDNATFLDLTIYGKPGNAPVPTLSLNQTLVERKLELASLSIQNLSCRSLVVLGVTNLKKVTILDFADFENSRFGNLQVENGNWPATLENIKLGGMSYQNIEMILESTPEDDWEDLITLINKSKYNAQAYTTLERYFSEQGYADRADEVYINYKKREFTEGLDRFSIGWWWNLLLRPIGYGRRPGYVFSAAVVVILVGWLWVFRKPEGMMLLSRREIVRPNVGHRGTLSRKLSKRIIFSQHEGSYSPFWYSLDLFIPFVDLGVDDKWAPKPHRKWAVFYSKLHMLAGWILIPIGLLAITGIIK